MNTFKKISAYAIFGLASCFGFVACDNGGTDTPDKPGLVLTVTPSTINIGETAGFKVMEDDKDVTASAQVLSLDEESKVVTAPWATGKQGTYRFSAAYNGRTSNIATCVVKNTGDVPSDFKRRVLAMDFTGVFCTYCPNMTRLLDKYVTNNPDVLVVVAAHQNIPSADPLTTPETEALFNAYAIRANGAPQCSIDLRGNAFALSGGATSLSNSVKKALENFPATCGIAIKSTTEAQKVSAEVAVRFSQTNDFKICALLVESEINVPGSYEGDYHHVVRKFATEIKGDDLGQCIGGQEYKHTYEFTADASWKLENCHVVVYMLKKGEDGIYTVNNVRDCAANGTVVID